MNQPDPVRGSQYAGEVARGRLSSAVAIVTGASRGIGLAIAERLIAEGARVAITARHADALAEAVDRLGGAGRAIGISGKADDPDHRRQVLATTRATFGRPTVLVNNVGINPVYGPLLDLDLDAARKIFEVNVLGTLAWTQAVAAPGTDDGFSDEGGVVINISSVAARTPSPGICFYGVSKAAINQLTASLAVELGPRIRVNAIAPAVVKTRFAAALYEGREEEVAAGYPLRRLGVPGDIAAAAAFLASSDSSWITGQVFTIDGGLLLAGGSV